MKISNESQQNILVKLNQCERVQRELNKLKFHLKMKKKLYDNTQYKNISERVQDCQAYFKKMKNVMIHQEADKILGKKTNLQKYARVNKLPASMQRQKANKSSIVKAQFQKIERYSVKMKAERQQLSKSRFVVEYQLQPMRQHIRQNQQTNLSRLNHLSSLKNEGTGERFISEFEKSIKQKLKRIPINKYGDIEEFDDILRRNERQSIKTDKISEKISKTNSLTLHSITANHSQSKRRQTVANQASGTTETIRSQRYELLRSKIDRCRTQLSERQKEQIDRISRQNLEYKEKNRILNNYYEKYSTHRKNGDPAALDLMCLATLARADLLLKQL